MIKLFGVLDTVASAFLFCLALSIPLPKTLLIIFGIYLIIKGIIFIKSIASIIDIVSGIILALVFYFAMPNAVFVIAGLLLLQKGMFSIISK